MRTARTAQKQPNMALEVGRAALFGVAVSFVLVVLYALALKEELLKTSTMGLFTTVIKVVCAALSGIIAVKRCKRRLWLHGAAAGAAYSVLAMAVYSITAGVFSPNAALLLDIAMCALSGLISVISMQGLK